MNPSDPDPVNEWNIDSSWQDWPHGGFWKTPLDGQEVPPASDPTAISSGMTDSTFDPSPIIPSAPSMFDVGRTLSESDQP
jgi:hypothetical protein